MDATARQLANIEAATGKTLKDFTSAVANAALEKHGEILAFLKQEFGLTHGNANLIAHKVRESLAGAPPPEEKLLDAQYDGRKAALRPIYEKIAAAATELGAKQVIQKTGVSFRAAKKQFALVQAPSAKRIQLGLNLPETPNSERVTETTGMCSHRVDIRELADVDEELIAWLRAAHEHCN